MPKAIPSCMPNQQEFFNVLKMSREDVYAALQDGPNAMSWEDCNAIPDEIMAKICEKMGHAILEMDGWYIFGQCVLDNLPNKYVHAKPHRCPKKT